jgi:hypothetical protein
MDHEWLLGLAVGFSGGALFVLLLIVAFVLVDPQLYRWIRCMLHCEHQTQPRTRYREEKVTHETRQACHRRCDAMLLDLWVVYWLRAIARGRFMFVRRR